MMDETSAQLYRFGDFRLDTRSRELRGTNGAVIPLTAKAFDTLNALVENRDRIMSKDDLLATVWPGRIVEENNLSQAISALRRALGTDASEHRYIVTIPGRGYRFVAGVEEGDGDPDVDGISVAPLDPPVGRFSVDMHDSRRALGLGALLFMVALFAITAWRVREPDTGSPGSVPVSQTTLAVLPFRSLTAGPRDELLELGLAETLVTRLARSQALRVRSLASVQRLAAGQPGALDALTAGRELGASYVVEGSTQRIGEQVRVNMRLLSVEAGDNILMSQTFDAPLDRVFTLQDDMGNAVTTALALQPVVVSARASSLCEGDDAEAFRALLRAQYDLHRRDSGMTASFQDVIRRDPACSRAYAGLATAYLSMAHKDSPPDEVFPLARGAAQQALRIDPDSADANMAYGRYLQLYEWDWRGSEEALRRAIALNPSLAEAHFALAHLLVTTGRFDEGLEQARQARELDPLSPLINALEAGFLSAANRPEAAAARVARALELEPDFWIGLHVRAGLALDRGDAVAAVQDLQRSAVRSNRNSQILAFLAIAYVAAGQPMQAEAILDELLARSRTEYIPATSLATVYNALGQTNEALDALERGFAAHDIRIGFLKVDARWNNLRGEPRFEALMRKLGLPEAPAHGRY